MFSQVRVAFACLAAIGILAGCAASGSQPPIAATQGGVPAAEVNASGNLLYVSDESTRSVSQYALPAGVRKASHKTAAAPHGECTDTAGNVFVTMPAKSKVLEYAHGVRRPIAELTVSGYAASACAVDPISNDVAVIGDSRSGNFGGIAVFHGTDPNPAIYTTPNVFRMYFAGYDDKGNLFVDGTNMHSAFEFAELPAGKKVAKAITLDQSIAFPGAVAWDGQHMAVGDQVSFYGASTIYQFDIKGTTGTLAGTTALPGSCDVLQFWIHGNRVIAANACAGTVTFHRYPQGGSPLKTIGGFGEPVGVTVSAVGS